MLPVRSGLCYLWPALYLPSVRFMSQHDETRPVHHFDLYEDNSIGGICSQYVSTKLENQIQTI
jgi:hypothetical protein